MTGSYRAGPWGKAVLLGVCLVLAGPWADAGEAAARAGWSRSLGAMPPPSVQAVVAKKRAAPAAVAPVSYRGIRYEAVPWGKARGLGQNGGYIAAVDAATGKELWLLKVYDVTYDDDLEGDKQDVFITRLSLSGDGRQLDVENERGGHFRVDLATRHVTPR